MVNKIITAKTTFDAGPGFGRWPKGVEFVVLDQKGDMFYLIPWHGEEMGGMGVTLYINVAQLNSFVGAGYVSVRDLPPSWQTESEEKVGMKIKEDRPPIVCPECSSRDVGLWKRVAKKEEFRCNDCGEIFSITYPKESKYVVKEVLDAQTSYKLGQEPKTRGGRLAARAVTKPSEEGWYFKWGKLFVGPYPNVSMAKDAVVKMQNQGNTNVDEIVFADEDGFVYDVD